MFYLRLCYNESYIHIHIHIHVLSLNYTVEIDVMLPDHTRTLCKTN